MTKPKPHAETSVLEWMAAAIGLALLGLVACVVVNDALGGKDAEPPTVSVQARRVLPSGDGYRVEFDAINSGGSTAAGVQITGELTIDGRLETASVTLDYVPGDGQSAGGLFFGNDPRRGALTLRAEGYQEP